MTGATSTEHPTSRRPFVSWALTGLAVILAGIFAGPGVNALVYEGERAVLTQSIELPRAFTDLELQRVNARVAELATNVRCQAGSGRKLICTGEIEAGGDPSAYAREAGYFFAAINALVEAEGLVSPRSYGGLTSHSQFLGTGISIQVAQRVALILFAMALIACSRLLLPVLAPQPPRGGKQAIFALLALSVPIVVATFSLTVLSPMANVSVFYCASRIGMILLSATGEELLFRGWMIGTLGTRLGAPFSIALSSVVFSLSHSFANPLSYLVSMLIGACLGHYFHVRKSLVVCIVVHAAYNLLIVAR